MAIDVTTLVGGALGGAVAQSVLGPLFGQRHERRELRSAVLRGIVAIEDARWAPAEKQEFLRQAHELKSSALVAGLSRKPVDFYLVVSAAARQRSEESLEEAGGDIEFGGGIPVSLADLAAAAAALVTDCAWHPHWQRVLLRVRLARLEKRKSAVTEELNQPYERIHWDRGLPVAVGAARTRSRE